MAEPYILKALTHIILIMIRMNECITEPAINVKIFPNPDIL